MPEAASRPSFLPRLWRAMGRFLARSSERRIGGVLLAEAEPAGNRFALRRRAAETVQIAVRGETGAVTQLLIDATGSLAAAYGLVLVEYREAPREWMAADVPRGRVLEALMSLRDLLGTGGLDVAVHSPGEHVELILDRFGVLEIRAGVWHEPRLRSLLTQRGFVEDPGITVLPPARAGEFAWTRETDARFAAVKQRLALHEPPAADVEGLR